MTERTILEEIRHVRHVISAEIAHDPRRIAEYYAILQAGLKSRMTNRSGHALVDHSTPLPATSISGALIAGLPVVE